MGECHEILETSEKIFIGTDFPDEFSHSKDTKTLQGTNAKAKANIAQAIGDLIKIATNKRVSPDYENKHKSKARNGWYRYDVRFALPVYGVSDELERYNIFTARLVVRHDRDGKLYLYDILRTKKETSKPSGQ